MSLVGGLVAIFYFSIYIGNWIIIPIDELIFFRGVQPNHQPGPMIIYDPYAFAGEIPCFLRQRASPITPGGKAASFVSLGPSWKRRRPRIARRIREHGLRLWAWCGGKIVRTLFWGTSKWMVYRGKSGNPTKMGYLMGLLIVPYVWPIFRGISPKPQPKKHRPYMW